MEGALNLAPALVCKYTLQAKDMANWHPEITHSAWSCVCVYMSCNGPAPCGGCTCAVWLGFQAHHDPDPDPDQNQWLN